MFIRYVCYEENSDEHTLTPEIRILIIYKVAMNPAGQVVGQINEVESCRGVINRLLAEYVDALEHVNTQLAG